MYTLIVTLCSFCSPVEVNSALPSLDACRQAAGDYAVKMGAWALRSKLTTFQTTMCRRNDHTSLGT